MNDTRHGLSSNVVTSNISPLLRQSRRSLLFEPFRPVTYKTSFFLFYIKLNGLNRNMQAISHLVSCDIFDTKLCLYLQ